MRVAQTKTVSSPQASPVKPLKQSQRPLPVSQMPRFEHSTASLKTKVVGLGDKHDLWLVTVTVASFEERQAALEPMVTALPGRAS